MISFYDYPQIFLMDVNMLVVSTAANRSMWFVALMSESLLLLII